MMLLKIVSIILVTRVGNATPLQTNQDSIPEVTSQQHDAETLSSRSKRKSGNQPRFLQVASVADTPVFSSIDNSSEDLPQVVPEYAEEHELPDQPQVNIADLNTPLSRKIISIVGGCILVILGAVVQWYNEYSSARVRTLWRGLAECVTIDANCPDEELHGRLVHVQGTTKCSSPVIDHQFKDACIPGALKLQSIVEVFEWVQTTGIGRRSDQNFHTEWTPSHHDSTRFRRPGPDNPRPPAGLKLGTFTSITQQAAVGGFALTDDMIAQLRSYEPATPHLPERVTAAGIPFDLNPKDGMFYARLGQRTGSANTNLDEPQAGDIRVRFLCATDNKVVTIVAVQCENSGVETFVPYRPSPRGLCEGVESYKGRLIEEGQRQRPYESSAVYNKSLTCVLCPCQTIAFCCNHEVTTKEIFYVGEGEQPMERPFQDMVLRSTFRVWMFRSIGWLMMFFGVFCTTIPFKDHLKAQQGLKEDGGTAVLMFSAIVTLVVSSLIFGLVDSFFRPYWIGLLAFAIIIFVVEQFQFGSSIG